MATKTHERADLRALRQALDSFQAVPDSTDDLMVRAVESYYTAANYQDHALIQSARQEIKHVLGISLGESIDHEVSKHAVVLDHLHRVMGILEGTVTLPDAETDEFGRVITLIVSQVLGRLQRFRRGGITLALILGVDIPNVAKFDDQITHWQAVKANLVDCWPWSDVPVPLPPADREMIAASRVALQAGERGESLEAVIARRRSK